MLHPALNNPTKFVVVSRGRTGTGLLRGLLKSHPNVLMLGEQFGSTRTWHSPKKDAYWVLRDKYPTPEDYIHQYIYRLCPIFIKAVGWNLQYSQIKTWKDEFDFVSFFNNNEVNVIHLVRKNFVDTILSNFLAKSNDVWMRDEYTNPVEVTPDAFLKEILTYEEDLSFFTQQFPLAHVVSYHELLDESTHQGILRFLGLPLLSLRMHPDTIKQRQKPQREMLVNFEEVKELFRGTRYFDQFE